MKFTLCKKQYLYIALAVLSLSLAITTHVFAQESQSALSLPAISNSEAERLNQEQSEMNERIEAGREERSERKNAVRGALTERIQDRIINLSRNMEGRMRAALERLEQIIGRMDSRIQKLEAEGVDTAQAETVLALAQESLKTAREALDGIDSTVVASITSDNPAASFPALRERYTTARNAIKDTHTHLQTMLAVLKDAVRASLDESGVSEVVSENDEPLTE